MGNIYHKGLLLLTNLFYFLYLISVVLTIMRREFIKELEEKIKNITVKMKISKITKINFKIHFFHIHFTVIDDVGMYALFPL